MKVFYKCACCNKPSNKLSVFTVGAGWKPAMWKCFDIWLRKFQEDLNEKNRHRPEEKRERLRMSLDSFEGEDKKVPWSIQEKYVPPSKRGQHEEAIGWEPDEFTSYSPADAWKEWENIDTYFKPKKGESEGQAKLRVMDWTTRGFKYTEAKSWIDAGFKGEDADLCMWCKKKNWTPDYVLNHHNYNDLKADFQEETKPDIDEHHEN